MTTKKTILTIAVALGLLIVGAAGIHIYTQSAEEYQYEVYRHRQELAYFGSKDDLVYEVDNYIQSVAPGSCMNAITLVDVCDEEDIDLIFVIAQAQLESSFGTKGLGARMNSVFNVGAFDGKGTKHMVKYDHPDMSVEPYISLLKNDYLVDGKTEADMMDKYINANGKRYATDKRYEELLRDRYDYIQNDTSIGEKYSTFLKYKIITGK